jgi:hypothetical protein
MVAPFWINHLSFTITFHSKLYNLSNAFEQNSEQETHFYFLMIQPTASSEYPNITVI